MGRIPDEIVQQLRDRVDIVDLVGRFVTLKKSGRNYKGLCPFHGEKTPSFNVNPDRQTFYCFGCHEGGSALTFLMRTENLTFPEAVRTLARECGIEIPETEEGERGSSEALRAANELAHRCYREALAAPGNPGAAYLAERGLDAATIERFGIGFAPDRWDFVAQALRRKGIPAEIGERAGLLAPRPAGGHYDRLRGRVVFPILDVRGRPIGFGGRALAPDQEPKYLNTPESPVFRKREAFFGFPHALEPIRRTERAVVVEGYFDLIALHRAGVEGAVATCGTALTPDHARNLRRRTRQVVLLFDGDEAGQSAAERSLEVLLPEGLRVRAGVLLAGDDPDSLLAREGAEAVRRLVEEAPAALDVAIRRAVARGRSSPWEKADAVASVAKLLVLVPDAVERGELVLQLALAVGTEPRHVEATMRAAARGGDARDAVPASPRGRGPEERVVGQLVRSLIQHPGLARRVPRDELAMLLRVRPLANLVAALIDAAGEVGLAREPDIEEIGESLGDEERSLLRSLAAAEHQLDEEAATRTVDDTVRWLRQRWRRDQQRALTERLREPNADTEELLREKQAQRAIHHPLMGS